MVSGALRGYGFSLVPAIVAIFGICGVRVGWVYTGFAADPTFRTLLIAYPVSWAVTAAAQFIVYLLYIRHQNKTEPEREVPA